MNRNEGRMGSTEEIFLEDDGVAPAAIAPEETSSTAKFSWSTPTETVTLPSQGVFYPPQHPLHGREEIEIRYMTAKEEDILTDRALLKNGTAIDRALQNLITDKNIKVNDMLVGDKNAVIVAARITGYGAEYDTKVTCPACAEVDDFSFDLSDVKAINTSEAIEELGITLTNRSTFTITLPFSKVEVECRLLTGNDEVKIFKESQRRQKKKMPSSMLTDQLKEVIISVNGDTDLISRTTFVRQMPAKDSRYLRTTLSKVTPNLDMTHTFECASCGHTADMEVPLTTDFFWPK
jgi:transcription elongation factor Elf1